MNRPDWGLERCITCYMCLATCPVYKKHPGLFLGPIGFVKLGNMHFNPVDQADRVEMASKGGIELCDLNGYCQEVCPQHIKIVSILKLFQEGTSKRRLIDYSGINARSAKEMTRGIV